MFGVSDHGMAGRVHLVPPHVVDDDEDDVGGR
jgi:hypothetical protein